MLECLLPLASRDFIMPTTDSGGLGALGFDEYIINTANLKKNNYFKQQSPASVLDFASIIYLFRQVTREYFGFLLRIFTFPHVKFES